MAKKDKAVYAPGELSRVREKLGTFDPVEAKLLAEKLGGEVGYERTEDQERSKHQPVRRIRHERVDVKIGDQSGRPRRIAETPFEVEGEASEVKKKRRFFKRNESNPDDDPLVPIRSSYLERIKMDRFAGQPEFEIKSPGQVFYSMISLFTEITDYVSLTFVNTRMPEYYKKIEVLVISTRTLLPRNNVIRSEKMKKSSPLVYSILDTIRYWDIEKISGDLARIQANPRNARVSDFAEIIRAIYKPLYILEKLDSEIHIRGAFKVLYKLLYLENPSEAQNKGQELIRTALTAFSVVRRDVHYLLYPLLMKFVSSRFVPYQVIFAERKNRIKAFLNVNEGHQIVPDEINMQGDAKDLKSDENQGEDSSEQSGDGQNETIEEKELSEEEKARLAAEEAEKKALERGLQILEMLFPKAGWDRLPSYPDLYPYFVEMFDLKKGVVNIAPTDPLQQVYILMRSLEELFFGLRYVSFSSVPGISGNLERVDSILGEIVNSWRFYMEVSFEKEYLPRMAEYVRILEGSHEERVSTYARRLVTELHWTKRFFWLPLYKFDALMPPSIQKKDTTPIYAKIKTLRKYLTAVASGIEKGNKAGGAEARAPCDGIENPWDPYVFQVPNPLSIRLDAILSQKNKTNATLIYFCLAITSVLDYLVNNEDSWAYGERAGPLFRSVNGEGITPLTGVDNRIDADDIFKRSLKEQQKKPETETGI